MCEIEVLTGVAQGLGKLALPDQSSPTVLGMPVVSSVCSVGLSASLQDSGGVSSHPARRNCLDRQREHIVRARPRLGERCYHLRTRSHPRTGYRLYHILFVAVAAGFFGS